MVFDFFGTRKKAIIAMWGEVDRIRGWAGQLFELWVQGAIKPVIARSFRFDEAAAAHHFIQDRKNIGKVVLVP